MATSRVSLTARGSSLRLKQLSRLRPFRPTDEIYFCHVLPGNRSERPGEFEFDLYRLTQDELRDLVRHIRGAGFELVLDARSDELVRQAQQERVALDEALRTGLRLKRKPIRTLQTKGFRRDLRRFQIPAVGHMISVPNAANFSVPGSGKTTIAIAAFQHLRQSGHIQKLVVIGPQACFAPWERELQACIGASSTIRISGARNKRRRSWRRAVKANVVLLNYHIAAIDLADLRDLLTDGKAMLVLDESHHIKSISEGRWAQALRTVAPLAAKRVILTGTPAPNSLSDLWSQFAFLYPAENPLGAREDYTYRRERGGDAARLDTRERVYPLFWRIRKRDLGLPKPKITRIRVKPGLVQTAIYDALALRTIQDADKAPKELARLREWRRAKMVRLLQAASNPALLSRRSEEFRIPPLSASGLTVTQLIDRYAEYEVPAKIVQAVKLTRDVLRAGRKVVIWTSFVHNIHMLLKLLKNAGPLPLYGGIPLAGQPSEDETRERFIDRFLNERTVRVLVANPAACGESISLHEACHDAIYLDRTFNCGHFMQSKDRIHRVGLRPKDKINYYLIQAKDTIDDVVESRLNEKQRTMNELLDAELSTVNLEYGEEVVSEESEEE